jgi:plastocyanin
MLRVLMLLTMASVAVGCGDQDEPPASPAQRPAPTAEATTDSVPAKAAVTIKGFTYSPKRVTVRAGGGVTWTDEDASNHTVTFAEDGPEDIGNLREGRKATVKFTEPGSYAYICEFHPGMAGTVEVR